MRATNLLFILSDEHTRDIAGCYGNGLVRTPNLDRLAARGTRFSQAYTNCPICVPARASLATGRYVSDLGNWDNAHPYTGAVHSWHHRLTEAGHRVTSIGKLHFRSTDDPNGFSEEVLPLHVLDGKGDLLGLIRRPVPAARGNMPALARDAGAGPSTYCDYDTRIADAAVAWLRDAAARRGGKPWTLFVSFVRPHFPLVAPQRLFDLYPREAMPWPRLYAAAERPHHPALDALRRCMNYDDYFTQETVRTALAAYYALVTFLDENIGRVLGALEDAGLAEDTRVIYSTDHGDNLGTRGLWGKSVMYEESTAVPLILAGPDVPVDHVVETPVSLVDIYPTAVECAGEALTPAEQALPGRSLWGIALGAEPDRAVLSEYHAAGSITGMFMLRLGRWKYIYYPGYAPQLFDIEEDPGEVHDLGASHMHTGVRAECQAALRRIVDPEAANARAFRDQEAMIAAHGGREALTRRGDFGYTPAPGEKPGFA